MEFPQFKPIELGDRQIFHETLWKFQPENSEWTFTNLFIWRGQYEFQWSRYKNWLIVLSTANPEWYAFEPIGPPPRLEAARLILEWLRDEKGIKDPRMERAGAKLVKEIEGGGLASEPQREHFDYIYRTEDLIRLAGRRYHPKKNHVNRFRSSHAFTYSALGKAHIPQCLELSGVWCEWRRCSEDMNLMREWDAVREALYYFEDLKIQGGVILIEDQVRAFALGELLNEQTAVTHVEKADPKIPELYTMMNQQFCENQWAAVPYVNREQDLGDPGLRQSKLSYQPDHFVEKFRIRLA